MNKPCLIYIDINVIKTIIVIYSIVVIFQLVLWRSGIQHHFKITLTKLCDVVLMLFPRLNNIMCLRKVTFVKKWWWYLRCTWTTRLATLLLCQLNEETLHKWRCRTTLTHPIAKQYLLLLINSGCTTGKQQMQILYSFGMPRSAYRTHDILHYR